MTLAADVFWSRAGGRRGLQFKRFPTLADAVRFLKEDKTEIRSACTIETDEGHFDRSDIEVLYASLPS